MTRCWVRRGGDEFVLTGGRGVRYCFGGKVCFDGKERERDEWKTLCGGRGFKGSFIGVKVKG